MCRSVHYLVYTSIVCLFSLGVTNCAWYRIDVSTNSGTYSGTEDKVYITLSGNEGRTKEFQLTNPKGKINNIIHQASVNRYTVNVANIGIVCQVKLRLGGNDGWSIAYVSVTFLATSVERTFIVDREIDDRGSTVGRKPVHGGWSCWGEWGNCSGRCDREGRQRRYRTCDRPKPGCGGRYCAAARYETRRCRGLPCPTTTTTTTTTTPTTTTTTTTIPTTITTMQTTSNVTSQMTALPASVNCTMATSEGLIGDISSFASLGIVFALSVVLNSILAVFLFTVLRHKRMDNSYMLESRSKREEGCQ